VALRKEFDATLLQARVAIGLPALLGLQVGPLSEGQLEMTMPVSARHMAPNGYLHAASVIALADTACGFACFAHLPEGAQNFTTIELKTNFLGTAKEGKLKAEARAVHLGRTTQVWDATVTSIESGRQIAMFRCTQMVLWPKAS
jgi:1,4-dihydroxy-2-naphthoyl-CoA hydrolase